MIVKSMTITAKIDDNNVIPIGDNLTKNYEWGPIRAQQIEKKPEIIQAFSSEIVKVGKTLTKHIKGAKKIRAVVYVSNPKEISVSLSIPLLKLSIFSNLPLLLYFFTTPSCFPWK